MVFGDLESGVSISTLPNKPKKADKIKAPVAAPKAPVIGPTTKAKAPKAAPAVKAKPAKTQKVEPIVVPQASVVTPQPAAAKVETPKPVKAPKIEPSAAPQAPVVEPAAPQAPTITPAQVTLPKIQEQAQAPVVPQAPPTQKAPVTPQAPAAPAAPAAPQAPVIAPAAPQAPVVTPVEAQPTAKKNLVARIARLFIPFIVSLSIFSPIHIKGSKDLSFSTQALIQPSIEQTFVTNESGTKLIDLKDTYLFIGRDGYGNADVLQLINLSLNNHNHSILSLYRDTR